MTIKETAAEAAAELRRVLRGVDEEQIQKLARAVLEAERVFFAGAGRSLLALRCVAMRFMHLGIESHVAGDTTTPAFEENDLLIVGSGTGGTAGLVTIAKKAKKLKGRTALVTASPGSPLGKLCGLVVVIPAAGASPERKPLLPMGSLFEQALLLLGDALAAALAAEKGVDTEKPFARHANLE